MSGPKPETIEREIARMWLRLGRAIRNCVNSADGWCFEDPKSTQTAIEWAELAEKCLRKAASQIADRGDA